MQTRERGGGGGKSAHLAGEGGAQIYEKGLYNGKKKEGGESRKEDGRGGNDATKSHPLTSLTI